MRLPNIQSHRLGRASAALKTVFVCALAVFSALPAWALVELSPRGTLPNIGSGAVIVDLRQDGATLLAASPGDDTAGTNAGAVRVYDWDGLTWQQRGSTVLGLNAGDQFGESASLNGDSAFFVAGSSRSSIGGFNSGQVRVFEWDGTNWVQRGAAINGGQADRIGSNVSISSDGNSIASTSSRGVFVLDWNGTAWVPRGSLFAAGSLSISLSADGQVVAVGDLSSGLTQVYAFNGTDWVQRGANLTIDSEGVVLNPDGTSLVVSSRNFSQELTQVFDWNGTSWVQRGATLEGGSADISLNGNTLVVGFNLASRADVYFWDETAWVQIATLLSEDSSFKPSVAMNAFGSAAAVGNLIGVPRVYDIPVPPSVEQSSLQPVTVDNVAQYAVGGSCEEPGLSVSLTATDGVLTTPPRVLTCSLTGYSGFLNLLPLAQGSIEITATITNAAGITDSDVETVSKTVPAATCFGSAVTIIWGPGAVATSGNDVIWGTDGADVINALGGDDTVCGRGGNDTINGGNGVDRILGGEGNDVLGGQGDDDLLLGEAGADRLNGGPGDDIMFGGEGEDDLRGQSGADTLDGGEGVDQFFGGSGNDIIATGPGGNLGTGKVVRGQGNNDAIRGSGEADDLEGGPGLDELFGSGGNDLLVGGNAADRLFGEPGEDTLEGGASNDILRGGTQDDILLGGTGDDDLFGEGGDDTLNGQGDTDDCNGGSTDETLGDSATNCETTTGIEL